MTDDDFTRLLRDDFSGSLRDEPDAPELAGHLPGLADALREAVLETVPEMHGKLTDWHHRIGCPCSQQLDAAVAFICAMDDGDLAKYFGRWVRETGIRTWLWNLTGDDRCHDG